jgi:hypothetical protein
MFSGEDDDFKAYINTSILDGIEWNAPELEPYCVDLSEAIQPVIYYDIVNLSDLYIGRGLLATLGYTYYVVDYQFEDVDDAYNAKILYNKGLTTYQELVKSYSGCATTLDPLDRKVISTSNIVPPDANMT